MPGAADEPTAERPIRALRAAKTPLTLPPLPLVRAPGSRRNGFRLLVFDDGRTAAERAVGDVARHAGHVRELGDHAEPRIERGVTRRVAFVAAMAQDPRVKKHVSGENGEGETRRRRRRDDGQKGREEAVERGRPNIASPMAMAAIKLGIRVPGADRALPPLAEARHGGVVPRHLAIDAPYDPSPAPQAQAE